MTRLIILFQDPKKYIIRVHNKGFYIYPPSRYTSNDFFNKKFKT